MGGTRLRGMTPVKYERHTRLGSEETDLRPQGSAQRPGMSKPFSFRYFKTCPEIIGLAVTG